jgi:hypothetical protein
MTLPISPIHPAILAEAPEPNPRMKPTIVNGKWVYAPAPACDAAYFARRAIENGDRK